ncbi:MAG: TetR family transcriptional regulator [Actinomycetota bacterium]
MAEAIRLVGRDGARSATVRDVASAADVSPALVMHHFGSKAGLLAACDDEVMDAIQQAVAALSADDRETGLTELLASETAGPAVSYVGRVLHDGGDAGNRWFDWMIGLTERGMTEMADAGLARPADDPQMQAVLLLAMDIGVVLLRQHVERYLGAAIDEPEITERWAVAELDLLTHGVLVAPPDGTEPT